MTTTTALATSATAVEPAPSTEVGERVIRYYAEATMDYRFWSPSNLNMHFGYGSLRNLFNREAMLDAMNARVLDTLAVPDRAGARIVDLGCGTGATIRFGANRTKAVRFTGVTLAPEHVRRARSMNRAHPGADRLEVIRADYASTPLDDASFDGAYALESACHSPGNEKAGLVAEASRLLKPGAKFVIADGFRTDGGRRLGPVLDRAYRTLCRSWALPGLADLGSLVAALERHGFVDVQVEDISWKVALSVMHVPFVSLAFLLSCLRKGDRPAGWRWSNMIASLLTMLVGLARWRFSYCIVTATKGPALTAL